MLAFHPWRAAAVGVTAGGLLVASGAVTGGAYAAPNGGATPWSRAAAATSTAAKADLSATGERSAVSAASAPVTLTGTVSASGSKFQTTPYTAEPGELTAVLSWVGSANLDLFLRKDGKDVAVTGTTSTPETIRIELPDGGNYQFGVLARSGTATYTITAASAPIPVPPPGTDPFAKVPGAEGTVRAWTPYFMKGPRLGVTREQAVGYARKWDVVAAHPETFASHVPWMKVANPNLRLLGYLNSTWQWQTDLDPSWYLLDGSGRRIYARGWTNTYLMNPTKPGYRQWLENEAQTIVRDYRMDGVFLDVLGIASLDTSYASAEAINPATGTVWDKNVWLAQTTQLAGLVKTSLGGRPVIGNGLNAGSLYFSATTPSRVLLNSGITAGMPEGFVRPPSAPIDLRRSEKSWKQDLDMMSDSQNRGQGIFPTTKVWTAGTVQQKQAWHEYALATYLMGNDGSSYFHFTYEEGDAPNGTDLDHIDLGAALGNYTAVAGIYQRSFARGKVVVNAGSAPATVNLGGSYRTLTGELVTSITIEAGRGKVLRSA